MVKVVGIKRLGNGRVDNFGLQYFHIVKFSVRPQLPISRVFSVSLLTLAKTIKFRIS